jgi:uncharacterized membrane protein AbrB (regulator of aidB expression)
MLLKNYKPFFHLFLFTGTACILHKAALFFFEINTENFYYAVEFLYLIFFASTLILYLILLIVKKKDFQIVGMVFLFGTFTEMLLGYLILQPILKSNFESTDVEKVSFFITFILFLLFKTLLTVRLLNEKS